MRLLMLGVYDINLYSRGRVLYKGLKKQDISVELFLPKSRSKYLQIAKKILNKDYDIILVTGKLCLFVTKLLKFIHRKQIIFDAFISDYDNLVNDRQLVKKKSLLAKLLWFGDKFSCMMSDCILLDTKEHIEYFVREFKLKAKKIFVVLVGSDNEIFYPRRARSEEFTVVFYGTFIPLQGVKFILLAAKILENENIKFNIIGRGQTYNQIMELYTQLKLKNICFQGMVSIYKLSEELAKADICLGIFGKSKKTRRVIPHKAFDTIAMKKPLLTSETPAIKSLFQHRKNVFLCKAANPSSLAKAILTLKNNPGLRDKIANEGYKLYTATSTPDKLGKRLVEIIKLINLKSFNYKK
ncbi:glycosyltransferase [Candidatus Woesearchaeota archaeon]|nr:glycosyltransferase [Candidatus Woesearchaeota archaeon]